ncbi:hypothetical protein [uncultured Microbacterium sp.]|uniref:hypothetical protein n=1 Tax=uncultured Microbacterium sp. TaxID=191216 RepID=UPI0035CBC9A7
MRPEIIELSGPEGVAGLDQTDAVPPRDVPPRTHRRRIQPWTPTLQARAELVGRHARDLGDQATARSARPHSGEGFCCPERRDQAAGHAIARLCQRVPDREGVPRRGFVVVDERAGIDEPDEVRASGGRRRIDRGHGVIPFLRYSARPT